MPVVTVVGDGDFLGLVGTFGSLGGDHDDAGGGTRAVDGGGGGAFQDVHAFDVLRIEEVHGRADDAIDDVEWGGLLVDGCLPADFDVETTSGTAVGLGDIHSGHGTLQCVFQPGRASAGQFLCRDGTDGAGEVGLLHGAVAYDDDFIQHFGVFRQGQLEGGLSFDGDLLRLVADEADDDGGVGGDVGEGEVAVGIGDGAVGGAFHHDAGADDGLAVGVGHCSFDFRGLLLDVGRFG